MTQFQLNLMPERKIWSVSELTTRIRDLLTSEFHDVWVEGEISNCHKAQSGHLYFTLKDERSQVRSICFRTQLRGLKFLPEDGLHVTVRGSVNVYEPRGEYQIYVDYIEPVGFGALQFAFEQLKKRLAQEGLFDPGRKKPIPILPRRIGLVTSPRGAAVRDVVRILRRRFPNVHLILYPVRVQGEGAAADIIQAIRYFNRQQLVDVMILARGGGSLEDLWAFNEESVARAISASLIPLISGVGHETDFTIADFVADVRASTPSAAAEVVVQTRRELDRLLAHTIRELGRRMKYLLLEYRHRVQALRGRSAFYRPLELVRTYRQRSDELSGQLGGRVQMQLERLRRRIALARTQMASIDLRARLARLEAQIEQRSNELRGRLERLITLKRQKFDERSRELPARMERLLAHHRQRIERLVVELNERSPLRVLDRGYAICYDAEGRVVRAADQIALGEQIGVQLARGRLEAEVKGKGPGR